MRVMRGQGYICMSRGDRVACTCHEGTGLHVHVMRGQGCMCMSCGLHGYRGRVGCYTLPIYYITYGQTSGGIPCIQYGWGWLKLTWSHSTVSPQCILSYQSVEVINCCTYSEAGDLFYSLYSSIANYPNSLIYLLQPQRCTVGFVISCSH